MLLDVQREEELIDMIVTIVFQLGLFGWRKRSFVPFWGENRFRSYVVFKESIPTVDDLENCPESEFTKLVSRGKLKYPPPELFDLALYMYTYLKWREPKCCSKIFEQGFKIIYDSSGCHFTDIEKILKRFVNCFCKGYAKEKTDQIKQKDKITHTERKKRKFRSR